jgi:transcriptional regulator with XRE-family HTH domain
MRQKKEMSQKDLARELGTSQNAIYRLENPKYGRPNISTLRKVASFFDVGLVVRFASFSDIADWTLKMSPQSIDVPSFEADLGFIERMPIDAARAVASQISAQWPLAAAAGTTTPYMQTVGTTVPPIAPKRNVINFPGQPRQADAEVISGASQAAGVSQQIELAQ